MKLEDHCKRSLATFGGEFREVHIWMDAFYDSIGARHRRERHHLKGIAEARALFGDIGGKVAEQHVVDDLLSDGDGWTPEIGIAVDRDHYIRMGLF